ncbi:MAG TPA: hypothetical protein VJ965_02160 [Anaerolineales bacterium]|nr:hypothetical protein [Anaerolineales bacterium]
MKTVFDVQAEVGLTKHLGSLAATEELVKLCHILPGYKVLDVGSGLAEPPSIWLNAMICAWLGWIFTPVWWRMPAHRPKNTG